MSTPDSAGTSLAQVQRINATPADMLMAVVQQPDASMEKIERFMALQERWEASQARKLFNAAMAKFREQHVRVARSATVENGPMRGMNYARLSDFVDAAAPALSAVGLSVSWKTTKQDKDWIEVACVVRHADGHQEETVLGGPIDASGAKNAIQARASTVTYLEKYTMKMALGLAEGDDDDDGNGGGGRGNADAPEVDQRGAPKRVDQPICSDDAFNKNLPEWTSIIEGGKRTAERLIEVISGKTQLTERQMSALRAIKPKPPQETQGAPTGDQP